MSRAVPHHACLEAPKPEDEIGHNGTIVATIGHLVGLKIGYSLT
jgi:hypothetical protein